MNLTKTNLLKFIAAVFIFIFSYTALSKFFDFENFKNVLGKSPLIGRFNDLIAWPLLLIELATAALLFFPKTRVAGLCVSFILMIIFTIYIGYMLAFAPHLPCSCGGVIGRLTWGQHLLFNVFFTIMAAVCLILSKQQIQQRNLLLQ